MTDQMIMYDSPEAAEYRTNLSGWVSRDGLYFGSDEYIARYSGCTHRPCCECGAATPKSYLLCNACRAKKDQARYEAMPEEEWDGKSMLYSEVSGEFYFDLCEAEDSLEHWQTLRAIRLVICRPVYASLDVDYFADDLPPEGEPPPELVDAIDAFNRSVAGVVLSWEPGQTRLKLPENAP